MKGKIRQLRMERSRKRMLAAVPSATVVVTNPTHYAVALKYDQGMQAPVCVAKGVDEVALRIREIANDAKVPIVGEPASGACPLRVTRNRSADSGKSLPSRC